MTRSPIRRRALWIAAIGLVGQVASAVWGDAVSLELQQTLESVLNLALLGGLVVSSEKVVTPVSDPRNNEGDALIPAAPSDPTI